MKLHENLKLFSDALQVASRNLVQLKQDSYS